MAKSSFFTRYNPPPSPSTEIKGESRTRQEFAAESDINRLVERFRDTGSFYDPLTTAKAGKRQPFFGDVTEVPDYQTALNIVIDAENNFASLPAKVRDRFNNNPQELIDFVSDEKNRAEAIELGLIAKPVDKPESKQEELPLEEEKK